MKNLCFSILIFLFLTAPVLKASAHEPDPSEILSEILNDQAKGNSSLQWSQLLDVRKNYRVVVEVFINPKPLGIRREFVLVSVDGQLKHVYVTTTGKPGHATISGSFPLTVEYHRGSGVDHREMKPFPFRHSFKYDDLPMFWALHITGGFFIHSTPYYGRLGVPSSHGCVRLDFPAAMELWDLVANQVPNSALIKIYKSGSNDAKVSLAEKGLTASWLNDQLKARVVDAQKFINDKDNGIYNGYGHFRTGDAENFPLCGGVDCFQYFGIDRSKKIKVLL